jgi:hypothetical protein
MPACRDAAFSFSKVSFSAIQIIPPLAAYSNAAVTSSFSKKGKDSKISSLTSPNKNFLNFIQIVSYKQRQTKVNGKTNAKNYFFEHWPLFAIANCFCSSYFFSGVRRKQPISDATNDNLHWHGFSANRHKFLN